MLNIIILEDQTEQAERLSQMLKKYAEAHEGFSYQLRIPLIIAPKPSISSPLTKVSRKSAIQAHCLHAK